MLLFNSNNDSYYMQINAYCYTQYSRVWYLETLDSKIRLDRKHHFGEKIARLVKYVDSIGSSGYFGLALETRHNTSIHTSISKCQTLLYTLCFYKASGFNLMVINAYFLIRSNRAHVILF
jgi:hypothetical protein